MDVQIVSKFCYSCKTDKESNFFYKNRSKPGGLTSMCKPCTLLSNKKSDKRTKEEKAIYAAAWRKKNPRLEIMRLYAQKHRLKHIYKITKEDYDQMLLSQDFRCAICKRKPAYELLVDHCHKTGKVRGLLCKRCNSALGAFGDNVEGVMEAIAYLSK